MQRATVEKIRADIPALEQYVWFQNGGVSVTPRAIAAEHARLMEELVVRGPMHIVYPDEEYPRRERSKAALARFFGVAPETLALMRGVSEAYQTVLRGLELAARGPVADHGRGGGRSLPALVAPAGPARRRGGQGAAAGRPRGADGGLRGAHQRTHPPARCQPRHHGDRFPASRRATLRAGQGTRRPHLHRHRPLGRPLSHRPGGTGLRLCRHPLLQVDVRTLCRRRALRASRSTGSLTGHLCRRARRSLVALRYRRLCAEGGGGAV